MLNQLDPSELRVVETPQTHLSEKENALLRELLRPGVSIDAVIPQDATAEELWNTLDACVRGLRLLEARICRLKPIIGRILLQFEQKPSLYKSLGYETYSDFMSRGVYATLGLHRTSAYESKLVARDWPQIDPDRYVKIGPKKLNIIAKTGITGNNSTAETLLKVAEKMKVEEFRTYVEQRGFIPYGESTGATLTIPTNRNRYLMFKEFFEDGRVHSVVGSAKSDDILEALIQECYSEWIHRYEAQEPEPEPLSTQEFGKIL
jgi:hypothetical protein